MSDSAFTIRALNRLTQTDPAPTNAIHSFSNSNFGQSRKRLYQQGEAITDTPQEARRILSCVGSLFRQSCLTLSLIYAVQKMLQLSSALRKSFTKTTKGETVKSVMHKRWVNCTPSLTHCSNFLKCFYSWESQDWYKKRIESGRSIL